LSRTWGKLLDGGFSDRQRPDRERPGRFLLLLREHPEVSLNPQRFLQSLLQVGGSFHLPKVAGRVVVGNRKVLLRLVFGVLGWVNCRCDIEEGGGLIVLFFAEFECCCVLFVEINISTI